jgi:hypothetical protein
MVSEMLIRLNSSTIEDVLASGMHEVLTWVVDMAVELSAAISDDYFEWEPSSVDSAAAGQ